MELQVQRFPTLVSQRLQCAQKYSPTRRNPPITSEIFTQQLYQRIAIFNLNPKKTYDAKRNVVTLVTYKEHQGYQGFVIL